MAYLHDSAVVYHGRLKSSNVLVDTRWTCKITDMGLRLFREGERSPDPDSNIYYYSKHSHILSEGEGSVVQSVPFNSTNQLNSTI